jgi:hypothetical protein
MALVSNKFQYNIVRQDKKNSKKFGKDTRVIVVKMAIAAIKLRSCSGVIRLWLFNRNHKCFLIRVMAIKNL